MLDVNEIFVECFFWVSSMVMMDQKWGLGYEANFLWSIIFLIFHSKQNNAVETPDRYEHDRKYLTYIFATSKFPVMEKLTNRTLVNPTPELSWDLTLKDEI